MRWKYDVLVFKVFSGGFHKLSYINSRVFTLDFTWNCCRLLEVKDFSKNPGQFKWVTRETKYRVSIAKLLIRNLKSQFAELVRRPKTYDLLYFSGDHQFFQNSPVIKSLYHWGRKRFSSLATEASFRTGEAISAELSTGEATGAHVTGALEQGV